MTLDSIAINKLSLLMDQYDFIAYNFDTIKEKKVLGSGLGSCRFCKGVVPNVSFKNKAHALPQFISNKHLLTTYECDDCNDQFSKSIENEFANFMKLMHTSYGVKGENKIPTYKNNGVRFESNGRDLRIENIDESMIDGNLEGKEFSIKLSTDKFIPIAVYKCLTKMALSVLPENDVPHFSNTFNWLLEKDHLVSEFSLNNLWIINSHLKYQSKFPHISATLLKKKFNESNCSPNFIFILTYAKFSFQIYLPLCDLDKKGSFPIEDLKYYPHLIDITKGLQSSEKFILDASSKEKSYLPLMIQITNLSI